MNILILIIACILIFLYLLQEGKTEGFLDNNQANKNYKERGAEKVLTIVTGVFTIAFIVVSLLEVVL